MSIVDFKICFIRVRASDVDELMRTNCTFASARRCVMGLNTIERVNGTGGPYSRRSSFSEKALRDLIENADLYN
jgi:hypothetical protein